MTNEPSGQVPPQYAIPLAPTKKTHPILIGCAGMLFVIGLCLVGTCVWLGSGPESGVKLANEMDTYALSYLEENGILNDTEKLVAYFDETISMDGTEAAILTTERVIYHKNNHNTFVFLTDIEDIRHRKEGLAGDIIEIQSKAGIPLKVEIAPLNGGETFYNALIGLYGKLEQDQEPTER